MSSSSKGPKWPGSSKGRTRLVLVAAMTPGEELVRVLESRHAARAPIAAPEEWRRALEERMSSDKAPFQWLDSAGLIRSVRERGTGLEGSTICAAFTPLDCRRICAELLGYPQLSSRMEIAPSTCTTLDFDAAGVALRELNVPWEEPE
ncbi:MAG: hypothetical protein JNJ88_05735 [Planctomycetes bacterium]|nr:hypothetical protein [Planctomycetota bacterium]